MRIIGHGIDIATISGIKAQVNSSNKNWTDNVYSTEERAQADQPPIHYRYYAGRFAAKEAVVKALGTGFAGVITWRGVEILRKDGGAPYVRLNAEVKDLAEQMGITDWLISLTYTEDLAMASAIAVGE